MRIQKHIEQEEGHFWPAYVDALTNVILNLLFFVALMAICVFAVGVSNADRGAEFLRYLKMLTQQPSGAELRFKVTAKSEATTVVPSQMQIDKLVSSGSTKRMRVAFAAPPSGPGGKESVQVQWHDKPEEKLQIQRALTANGLDVQLNVKVWVECECRSPLDKRTAYLRVLSVRNALVAMGVALDQISMQIEVDEIRSNNPNAVFIEWEF